MREVRLLLIFISQSKIKRLLPCAANRQRAEPADAGDSIPDPNVITPPDDRYRMYYCEMNNEVSDIYSMIGIGN